MAFDAGAEPYHGRILLSQLIIIIGGGTALAISWGCWLVALAVGVQTGRLALPWLANLLWAADGIVIIIWIAIDYARAITVP
jgi:hypothetical protein